MDWKRYYAAEWDDPVLRARVDDALGAAGDRDPGLDDALRGGGVVSFPHTTLRASAPALARVARAIVRGGYRRVIALGVLHGGTAPPAHAQPLTRYRAELLADRADDAVMDAIWSEYRGAVAPAGPIETRFGALRGWEPGESPFPPPGDLLSGEFSLDNFLRILALAAQKDGAEPPRVLPVYPVLTLDPHGGHDEAARIGRVLRAVAAAGDTAVVATGDVVHYGHGYSDPAAVAALPDDAGALAAHFRARVDAALAAALRDRDYPAFARLSARELRSDQLFVLPVIGEYLGEGAGYRIVEFTLTDYAEILGERPPCLVASALVAYTSPMSSGRGTERGPAGAPPVPRP